MTFENYMKTLHYDDFLIWMEKDGISALSRDETLSTLAFYGWCLFMNAHRNNPDLSIDELYESITSTH